MARLHLRPNVRRALIKAAAWDIAERDGHVEGITRERVARMANCATGSVSRYYEMPELVREVIVRARREKRWAMLRAALPGGKYHDAVKLRREEYRAIVDATIVSLKG